MKQSVPSLGLPLAGIVLSMVIAATVARPGSLVPVLCNALFWVCLLRYLAVTERGLFAAPWFLLFVPLFYLTFAAARPAVQLPDYVFNSDTERYLREAAGVRVQARHIGFPVVIFPMTAIRDAFSRLLGWPEAGREYLFLQSAAGGALLIRLLERAIPRPLSRRPPGPRSTSSSPTEPDRSGHGASSQGPARRRLLDLPVVIPLLVTSLFAFSLATWTFSSVIETFVFSALVFLLFLRTLGRYMGDPETGTAVALSLLTLIAVLLSLDNLFMAPVFLIIGGLRLISGRGRRAVTWLGHSAVYLLVLVAGFSISLHLAARASGPGFYRTWGDERFAAPAANLYENLHHFTADYLDAARVFSPRAHLEVAWRVFVMSIRGQPGSAPESYPKILGRDLFLAPGNLVFLLLLGIVGIFAARGLLVRARRDRPLDDREAEVTAVALSALLTLAGRQIFMVVYAPTQCILFSLPSLTAFWLLIGFGLARFAATRPQDETRPTFPAGGPLEKPPPEAQPSSFPADGRAAGRRLEARRPGLPSGTLSTMRRLDAMQPIYLVGSLAALWLLVVSTNLDFLIEIQRAAAP